MDKQKRKIILAACFLIVSMSVTVAPAMATDLKITDNRMAYLSRADVWQEYKPATSTTPASYFLKWNNTGLNLKHTDGTTAQRVQYVSFGSNTKFPGYQADSPTDTQGKYWGDCTSFAESANYLLGGHAYRTSEMKKGDNVIGSYSKIFFGKGRAVPIGTCIATFPPNSAPGTQYVSGNVPPYHAVVFAGYTFPTGRFASIFPNGFWVWDQRYYSGYKIITKHWLSAEGGSGTTIDNSNASNYYIVQV